MNSCIAGVSVGTAVILVSSTASPAPSSFASFSFPSRR